MSFAGPKRVAPLPFDISDLPRIDVVVISHGHYDHLDLPSLKRLAQIPGNKTVFLVPLGNEALLRSQGIEKVKELDWWEEVKLQDVTLTFTPSQHWANRGLLDRSEMLWGGWSIRSPQFHVLFAGDTGYSKDFLDIRERLGPADVALIPIGAYEPRWFMKKHHVNPEEAVQIHKDLQSKLSIAVHWGTFLLADEPAAAPAMALKTALQKMSVSEKDFLLLKHGETLKLDQLVR